MNQLKTFLIIGLSLIIFSQHVKCQKKELSESDIQELKNQEENLSNNNSIDYNSQSRKYDNSQKIGRAHV